MSERRSPRRSVQKTLDKMRTSFQLKPVKTKSSVRKYEDPAEPKNDGSESWASQDDFEQNQLAEAKSMKVVDLKNELSSKHQATGLNGKLKEWLVRELVKKRMEAKKAEFQNAQKQEKPSEKISKKRKYKEITEKQEEITQQFQNKDDDKVKRFKPNEPVKRSVPAFLQKGSEKAASEKSNFSVSFQNSAKASDQNSKHFQIGKAPEPKELNEMKEDKLQREKNEMIELKLKLIARQKQLTESQIQDLEKQAEQKKTREQGEFEIQNFAESKVVVQESQPEQQIMPQQPLLVPQVIAQQIPSSIITHPIDLFPKSPPLKRVSENNEIDKISEPEPNSSAFEDAVSDKRMTIPPQIENNPFYQSIKKGRSQRYNEIGQLNRQSFLSDIQPEQSQTGISKRQEIIPADQRSNFSRRSQNRDLQQSLLKRTQRQGGQGTQHRVTRDTGNIRETRPPARSAISKLRFGNNSLEQTDQWTALLMRMALLILVIVFSSISYYGVDDFKEITKTRIFNRKYKLFCPSEHQGYRHQFEAGCYDDEFEPIEDFETCMKFKDCISCPENGKCDESGKLECDRGYIKEWDLCVENQVITQQAKLALNNFQTFLQKKRGLYECPLSKIGQYWITYEIFEQQLLQQHEDSQELLVKMIQLLNRGDYPNVKITKSVDNIKVLDKNLNLTNIKGTYIYSDTPIFSYFCLFKIWIRQNLIFISSAMGFVTFLYLKLKKYLLNRRYASLARGLYNDILSELQSLNSGISGTITGLSEKDILRKYIQMAEGSDGLERNEQSFIHIVWPLMKEYRKREKQIAVFQRQQFGVKYEIWELK